MSSKVCNISPHKVSFGWTLDPEYVLAFFRAQSGNMLKFQKILKSLNLLAKIDGIHLNLAKE